MDEGNFDVVADHAKELGRELLLCQKLNKQYENQTRALLAQVLRLIMASKCGGPRCDHESYEWQCYPCELRYVTAETDKIVSQYLERIDAGQDARIWEPVGRIETKSTEGEGK